MKALRRDYGCPVEFALDCLGGKWKTIILAHLKTGALRYADLRSRVRPMSDKVLNERLLELQAAGLVEKHPVSGIYDLTDRGRSLIPILQALYDWGRVTSDAMNIRISRK